MQKLLLCLLVIAASAHASQEVRVAVATNFRVTLEQLNPAFESSTSIRVILSSGSTGGLYHQILSDAPMIFPLPRIKSAMQCRPTSIGTLAM
jgi:ABC-type molybdate transport system substrate-binding protein